MGQIVAHCRKRCIYKYIYIYIIIYAYIYSILNIIPDMCQIFTTVKGRSAFRAIGFYV